MLHRINDLREIARLAKKAPQELIRNVEARFDADIDGIAGHILAHPEESILLLAGPTSSGKTTTAHKIRRRLAKDGVQCVVVSLDDFFLDRNKLPLLPNGRPDMDSPASLDLPYISDRFACLLREGRAEFPIFDFKTGCRSAQTHEVILGPRDVLLVEGLHALSPALTGDLPPERFVRVFISAQTDYMEGERTMLSADVLRLLRRMVRDRLKRHTLASKTYDTWPSVRAVEHQYIYDYRKLADFSLDSFFEYELCLYRALIAGMMAETPQDDPCYPVLEQFFERVRPLPMLSPDLLPEDSLMWEFLPKKQ